MEATPEPVVFGLRCRRAAGTPRGSQLGSPGPGAREAPRCPPCLARVRSFHSFPIPGSVAGTVQLGRNRGDGRMALCPSP